MTDDPRLDAAADAVMSMFEDVAAGGEPGVIARAAVDAADRAAWRPIETAPRDGTLIDVWSPTLSRMPNVAWQDEMMDEWASRFGGYKWRTMAIIAQPPWLLWSDPLLEAPTHWMPLPSPPQREDDGT